MNATRQAKKWIGLLSTSANIDGGAPKHRGVVGISVISAPISRINGLQHYRHITLVAGGGVGYDKRMIGYCYWPKLGFDAPLEEQDAEIPAFADCNTVLDVLAHDEAAWAEHGSQRLMEFDLAPDSRSWGKLLDYLREKELL